MIDNIFAFGLGIISGWGLLLTALYWKFKPYIKMWKQMKGSALTGEDAQ